MKPTPRLERALTEARRIRENWLNDEDIVLHGVGFKPGTAEPYWAGKVMQQAVKIEHLEDALDSTNRSLTIYRWLCITGWLVAILALSVQPARAATLPVGSLACDNALAYEAQMLTFSDATVVADPGCVFTDRDLKVYVVSGNEVFVEEIGFSIWADAEVLR